jgi:hypothetical protein
MMFFRWDGERRKIVDLQNMYKDQPVFLLGGHPSIKNEDLSLLQKNGVLSMSMNNTGTLARTDFWLCADPPSCYSSSIIKDPSVLKFARLNYTNQLIDNKMWKDYSSTLFYGGSDQIKFHNLLEDHRQCAWWKNVFVIAIQILYHMGFRKIYTVGCHFNIDKKEQYAYETNLKDDEVHYNQATYNMVVNQIKECIPHFKNKGLEIISCTEGSKLNEIFAFKSFEDAINQVCNAIPSPQTLTSKHSSHYRKLREGK